MPICAFFLVRVERCSARPDKPDLVYLHRYANAAKYASLVRQHFPECFITYNVADLHFLRQKREIEIAGSEEGHAVYPKMPNWPRCGGR